jgi:hypothetical protein
MIRHLADASARGILESLLNAFTDPSKRPAEMKQCVMPQDKFLTKLGGFVGDGASVNGVSHGETNRGPKTAIEIAKPGDNLFHHLSELKKIHSEIPIVGVWCSAHRVEFMADAVTDAETKLPTFSKIGKFLEKLCNHVDYSGKAKDDLEFLKTLMLDTRVKTGSMRISGKQWLSNVPALRQVTSGLVIVHVHCADLFRRVGAPAKTKQHMRQILDVLEDPVVHVILPAYFDMQKRLKH